MKDPDPDEERRKVERAIDESDEEWAARAARESLQEGAMPISLDDLQSDLGLLPDGE